MQNIYIRKLYIKIQKMTQKALNFIIFLENHSKNTQLQSIPFVHIHAQQRRDLPTENPLEAGTLIYTENRVSNHYQM